VKKGKVPNQFREKSTNNLPNIKVTNQVAVFAFVIIFFEKSQSKQK
jgi:hypothetical protein